MDLMKYQQKKIPTCFANSNFPRFKWSYDSS